MATPVVNRVPHDFATIEAELSDGDESWGVLDGVTEIEYSDSVEREKLRGTSRTPIAATDGEYDAEGSMTVYRYYYDYLVEKAKAKGKGLYELSFTLTINYAFRGEPVKTDVITGVRIASREHSGSQGPDPLDVPLELFIGGLIYHEGIGPFGETL